MRATDEVKTEVVEKASALAGEKLPVEQAVAVQALLCRYWERMAPEDVVERSAVDLYSATLAHLRLAERRLPGVARLRVYTPRIDVDGWQSTHSVVQIVTDDMPFLVDSTTMELNRHGLGIHLVVHPVVWVRRDPEGRLLEIVPSGGEGAVAEAFVHVEIDRQDDARLTEELAAQLERVLEDVRLAVRDWAEMRARAEQVAADAEEQPSAAGPAERTEIGRFLRWLADDHFTFLGYREYELGHESDEPVFRAVESSGLGVMGRAGLEDRSPSLADLSPRARERALAPRPLLLTTDTSRATVHRPGYLDYVLVRRFDDAGRIAGERRFLGLYTSSVYTASPFDVPVLRGKLEAVIERAGFPAGSHDAKKLVAILESYPRDELFQIGEDELFDIAMGILGLEERHRVRLFVRRDAYERFFSCLVFVPRDRLSPQLEERMQQVLLRAFGGERAELTVRLSESVLARLHVIVHTPRGHDVDFDVRQVEGRLAELARSWVDELYQAVVEHCGEAAGVPLFHRYRHAFPAAYREDFSPRHAVEDIISLEGLEDLKTSLYRPLEAAPGVVRFKLFRIEPVSMSAVLPLLEHMGVTVVDQRPYEVRRSDGRTAWVYDFGLRVAGEVDFDTARLKETFQDAFAQAWAGVIADDRFNRLVLGAGLACRDITVLRAYSRYLRQIGSAFSQAYMEDSLAAHPQIARRLVDLFHARFDPDGQADALDRTAALVATIEEGLDGVASLDEDRILRAFLRLIQATVRTNYFRPGESGRPRACLALKFDSALIPDLPRPWPMFEIFVYSPRIEGVHLRGGRVARGGLRWSDRREDFRTEILGLMKAQMVKNAVIVPVGAKGGFVVQQPPADRSALAEEVLFCYRTFISGLLDVTDNLVDGHVVPPDAVVRYDGDDPYLVVAADKGTATFSDVANDVAHQYGFWLGDAFASGGSAGYDHKRMGITARGAWTSVTRHFRELDLDVDTTDFTVVGIGDMSGDVFGNGMLLSRHIKLVGAFDHRHIFLDPDPDPGVSYGERERLFGMARSSWADYDPALISPGGGVFPRSAKSIPLSPEMQAVLGLSASALPPNEVIRGLLRAPVDLLWNGGIGTYVKAGVERHAEVGDKTNEAVRVDGGELRCRVAAEGGNLGFSQRGRIEYALGGGRINTDFIDNAAGVDCSDHEVNIKILLDGVVAEGDLTPKQRNALLAEMTDEVAALVLEHNYRQNEALANAAVGAALMLDVHARYLRALEAAGRLDRALEFLPDDEALVDRAAAGRGLTAPELAVLLTTTKLAVYEECLASDLPDDPALTRLLHQYFPAPLSSRFSARLPAHRLRREIIARVVTNTTIDRAGLSFVFRLGEETGAAVPEIVAAHLVASEIYDMRGLWQDIEALDHQVATATQVAMRLEGRKLVERATRWLLRNRRRPLDIEGTITCFRPGVARLGEHVAELVTGAERRTLDQMAERLAAVGVPEPLPARVAAFAPMFSALDIVAIAEATGQAVEEAGAAYFLLGHELELDWLRDRIVSLARDDRWQALVRDALRDDLYSEHRALATQAVTAQPGGTPAERVSAWMARNRAPVGRYLAVLNDIKAGGAHDLATLPVALRQLRDVLAAGAAA